MVNSLNGADGLGKFSGVSSIKDFMNVYKNNMNEINGQNESISADSTTLKGGISKNDVIYDAELSQDLNKLTNKYYSADDVSQMSTQNMSSADKTAKDFSRIIGNYMTDVSDKEHVSDNAMQTFASGGDIDMHSVMIAAEKASTSMQLTLQLRNKLLQAYQEVSKMQI